MAQVNGEVGQISGKLGFQLPANEVLFFGSLPLRVDDVTVKAGDELTGPVMTVSNAQLAVDGGLSLNDAKLVRKGAAVTMAPGRRRFHGAGTWRDRRRTRHERCRSSALLLRRHVRSGCPTSLVGASVVLTITVSSTEGEVLTVPIAALSVAADGTSRVQVHEHRHHPDRHGEPRARGKGHGAGHAHQGPPQGR